MNRIRYIARIVTWTGVALGIVFLAFVIIAPMGTETSYSQDTGGISDLGPADRVRVTQTQEGKQTAVRDDLVYFTVDMPRPFDTADITIELANPWPDQDILLGFRDRVEWHYTSTLIDAPVLNAVPWKVIGTAPALYQRIPRYEHTESFLDHPPETGVIGLYHYDPDNLVRGNYQLKDYRPAPGDSVVSTPLRGKHTLFAYAENEPFIMHFTKQDLNWYDGQDIMTVDIFKEGDLVYHTVIGDDGNAGSDRQARTPQTVTVRNPGPGLPETGVYKVVIDAPTDTVIRSIRTNLSKFVLDGPLFAADNSDNYPSLTATTSGSTFYTDSVYLTAMTPHANATQSVTAKDSVIALDTEGITVATVAGSMLGPVTAPVSDVIINGVPGYFSVSPDHFFRPFLVNTYQITGPSDIPIVDYILADYTRPVTRGQWRVATVTVPLTRAAVRDGKLDWVLKMPKLRERNREVTVGNIRIVLRKKPAV